MFITCHILYLFSYFSIPSHTLLAPPALSSLTLAMAAPINGCNDEQWHGTGTTRIVGTDTQRGTLNPNITIFTPVELTKIPSGQLLARDALNI